MARIGIIGAGPAGIFAALQAAQSQHDIHLFDSNKQVGRKILVSGSGRCNLTNTNIRADRYACSQSGFVQTALSSFNQDQLLATLHELGILTYSTSDGWVYPLSNSAANVASLLEAHLKMAGVHIAGETTVTDIKRTGSKYTLLSQNPAATGEYDRVVIATGGKAYPTLGSTGSLFPVIQRLGHEVLQVHPALAPIRTDTRPIHKLQGVRLDAGVKLFSGDRLLGETTGNIIFTEWGLNGPGVMDLSHHVNRHTGSKLTLVIDFLAGKAGELHALIASRRSDSMPVYALIGSVLPPKVIRHAFSTFRLPQNITTSQITGRQLQALFELLTHFELGVQGTRGFEYSQASTGGVSPAQVDPTTMESKLLPGLFFAGEVLDVVGPCGGFNLQWAFTSGYLAGRAAVLINKEELR